MKPTYRTKKWNSLSDFKDYLIKNEERSGSDQTVERVIEFYGYELITDKGSYGLVDGVLSFMPKE
jgi:hypothetical protein